MFLQITLFPVVCSIKKSEWTKNMCFTSSRSRRKFMTFLATPDPASITLARANSATSSIVSGKTVTSCDGPSACQPNINWVHISLKYKRSTLCFCNDATSNDLYKHTCNLLHRLHNWVIYMTPSDVYKDKTLSRQHQSSPVWSRQSKTRKYRHLCCDIVQWFTIAYSIKWPWILCPLELRIMCLRVSSCLGWARPLCLNTSLMTPHSSLLFHVEEDLITFLE